MTALVSPNLFCTTIAVTLELAFPCGKQWRWPAAGEAREKGTERRLSPTEMGEVAMALSQYGGLMPGLYTRIPA